MIRQAVRQAHGPEFLSPVLTTEGLVAGQTIGV